MTRWLCLKAFDANFPEQCRLLRGFFLFLASFPYWRISNMRGSRHQKLIWIGPMSRNISLGVISVVAKFHAFIINLNNSVFFRSITAGLHEEAQALCFLFIII